MQRYAGSTRLSVLFIVLLGQSAFAAPKPYPPSLLPGVFYHHLPSSSTVYMFGPGTAYSANTHANADFLRAVGSLRVDTAIARNIAADAYTKELENAKLEVKVYFERRLANRAYRRMLESPHAGADSPGNSPTRSKSPGEDLYDKARKGDFSKEMNWLLMALFKQREYDNAAFKEAVSPGSASDLDPAALGHVWLIDRPENGLDFRADAAIPLKETWPDLLQRPEFDEVRREFEKARDEALDKIKKEGKKDYVQNENVRNAWEKLVWKFYEEYRPKLGVDGSLRPADYVQTLGFLRSLKFQVYRFVQTNFQRDDYRFQGNRLVELVDFMGARGLYFGKPRPGDEGTYQTIFFQLQEMYERALRWDRPITQK